MVDKGGTDAYCIFARNAALMRTNIGIDSFYLAKNEDKIQSQYNHHIDLLCSLYASLHLAVNT